MIFSSIKSVNMEGIWSLAKVCSLAFTLQLSNARNPRQNLSSFSRSILKIMLLFVRIFTREAINIKYLKEKNQKASLSI